MDSMFVLGGVWGTRWVVDGVGGSPRVPLSERETSPSLALEASQDVAGVV